MYRENADCHLLDREITSPYFINLRLQSVLKDKLKCNVTFMIIDMVI